MVYYKVIGSIDGEEEQLFGSFVKRQCVTEINSENDSWINDGYSLIHIKPVHTDDEPDPEVYTKEEIEAMS